jgi:hypothetical protein
VPQRMDEMRYSCCGIVLASQCHKAASPPFGLAESCWLRHAIKPPRPHVGPLIITRWKVLGFIMALIGKGKEWCALA